MNRLSWMILAWLLPVATLAEGYMPAECSVAALMPLAESGRVVYDFNGGWRFHKGDVAGAEAVSFDDSAWEVVSTPHTVELVPAEVSGCRNYQGVVWYRKHFTVPADCAAKEVLLHFEAVMGKQAFYINGKLVEEHLGGYLPVMLSLSEAGVKAGERCVVAVMADNSNDKTYPPGQPQYTLDFAYHGGIYRDVLLICRSEVALTDPVEANRVAGGGIFVHFDKISKERAEVYVKSEIENKGAQTRSVVVETSLKDAAGILLGTQTQRIILSQGAVATAEQRFTVKNPHLWSPDDPYLYRVETRIKERKSGRSLDGGVTRIGIRSFAFSKEEGFLLNGEPFGKLIGANRHQDFAYVGNALPNSQQWRDAKRLRDAGCRIIRVAHYPQDPSFMDACDELGLFVIVATPGWQYWNKDPKFAERVHQNTREIIRRDRNHPSVLMWEPILNETRYPHDFSLEALQITKDEYPYPYRPVAAADVHSAGVKEHYDVVYAWPGDEQKEDAPEQTIFTREWGENVDDWYAHNNNNRASRSWGERPQLIQAMSLADTYNNLYNTEPQFIGGAQWHPFDHQRGYHPDPYWGGIYDAFRQPKYAYWMFRSQTDAALDHPTAESGPMLYIAHEMSQWSDKDVTIFTNCDSVRLTIYDGAKSWTKRVERTDRSMPNPPIVFEDVWDFWEARSYSYTQKNWQAVKMVAEGYVDGKVVCTEQRMPSRRSTKLRLYVDWEAKPLVADGSDFVVVVAEVTDDSGHVRRMAKEHIRFTVEGEGELIGDASIHANPRPVEWGSAPILVRSTRTAGKIRVRAEVEHPGTHAPTAAEIEFESIPAQLPFCHEAVERVATDTNRADRTQGTQLSEEEKRRLLEEVDRQQQEFGVQ
ncbi:MAG: glycoside hydrolase family 2 [Alistipes sp.]|nr:glycoside hydrolase family 2 [Alistipes sp.]